MGASRLTIRSNRLTARSRVSRSLSGAIRLMLLTLLLLNAACSRFSAVDKPLAQWTPQTGEVSELERNLKRSPEIVVLLAFSGGGSRASALSYGVLKELAETKVETVQGTSTVLAEVDMISAVSAAVSQPPTTGSGATVFSTTTKSDSCAKTWKARCSGSSSTRSTGCA